MTPSTISVALCTYNGARFIEQQLRSILAQGDLISEIVIADDGSTDATLDIVRRIAAESTDAGVAIEFRLLTEGGGHGVTKNFERAVIACRSDFIALSDQDDIWHPSRLRRLVEQFEQRPNLLFLHTDARLVDENGNPLGHQLLHTLEVGAEDSRAIHGGDAFWVFLRRNLATGATSMFRRSLLESALPFSEDWVHDEWLAIIAAAVGELDFLPEPLIDYRQHGANQIGVRTPTLAVKVRRVLEPRGARNRELALRSASLLARLVLLGPLVAPNKLAAARNKVQLETFRAGLPRHRIKRILPVFHKARTGQYVQFASQGRLDIIRDLLQPF